MGCGHSQGISEVRNVGALNGAPRPFYAANRYLRERSASLGSQTIVVQQHGNYIRHLTRDNKRVLVPDTAGKPSSLPVVSKFAKTMTSENQPRKIPTTRPNGKVESLVNLCLRVVCQNRNHWVGENIGDVARFADYPSNLYQSLFQMLLDHRLLHQGLLRSFKDCSISSLCLNNYPGVNDLWIKDILHFRHLKKLDLSGCAELSDDAFRTVAYMGYGNGCLTDLQLCGCVKLTDGSLAFVIHAFSSNLELLNISGCVELTDSTLSRVLECKNLKYCYMDKCKHFTQAYLCQLGLLSRLRELSLDLCPNVDDNVLRAFQPSYGAEGIKLIVDAIATSLFITQGRRGSVAIRETVYSRRILRDKTVLLESRASTQKETGLSVLEKLNIGWTNVTDKGCDYVSKLKLLRSLRVSNCSISSDGFRQLFYLDNLESLDARYCTTGKELDLCGLNRLGKLKELILDYAPVGRLFTKEMENLLSLSLCNTTASELVLPSLNETAPKLKLLKLEGLNISSKILREISKLEKLERLNLYDTALMDVDLVNLKGLYGLKSLDISHSKITAYGVKILASHLLNLESLCLDSMTLTNDALKHLRVLPKLKRLDLFGSFDITDEGLLHIGSIKTLTELEICSGKIRDNGVKYLCGLENLQKLNISQNDEITDKSLGFIAKYLGKTLKSLNVSHTGITPSGILALTSMKNLEELTVRGLKQPLDCTIIAKLLSEIPGLWYILA